MTTTPTVESFRATYWLKTELVQLCREHGLSTAGGKREIAARIEHFLETGERLAPAPVRPSPSAEARRVNTTVAADLSMQTRAPQGFRCTQAVRAFFVQHLGDGFRFTVTLQTYIKDHPGITLRDIADEWLRQEQQRKSGQLRTEIGPQFEYNQFTRDFFSDPCNAGKTRHDCLEAWKRTRALHGEHKYRPGC